ncbi:MAG: hypothetical protein KBF57_11840, partial [Saprospiraceae bacterium]|nr:hypothetical protein [Saprospiraceae bacterium]
MKERNLLTLLILMTLFSCRRDAEIAALGKMEFNSEQWKEGSDGVYPYREKMVDDLLKRYDWEGMPRAEVEALLGKPGSGDSLNYVYMMYQKKVSFFRLHTHALVVKFRE